MIYLTHAPQCLRAECAHIRQTTSAHATTAIPYSYLFLSGANFCFFMRQKHLVKISKTVDTGTNMHVVATCMGSLSLAKTLCKISKST